MVLAEKALVSGVSREEMYDETPEAGSDGLYGLHLMPGLSEWEQKDAQILAQFARGIIAVVGPPGSGKDVFLMSTAFKMRRYFGKTVLLDQKPRKLFDEGATKPYQLFNKGFLANQLECMAAQAGTEGLATGDGITDGAKKKNKEIVNTWVEQNKELYFSDAVLGLGEFWRYMWNRDPFNSMGMTLAGLIRVWRHLDLLILGVTQKMHDLDQFTALPFLTHRASCTWVGNDTTEVTIRQIRYVGSKGVIDVVSKPFKYFVNGGEERPALGGKRYFDLFNSKNSQAIPMRGKK